MLNKLIIISIIIVTLEFSFEKEIATLTGVAALACVRMRWFCYFSSNTRALRALPSQADDLAVVFLRWLALTTTLATSTCFQEAHLEQNTISHQTTAALFWSNWSNRVSNRSSDQSAAFMARSWKCTSCESQIQPRGPYWSLGAPGQQICGTYSWTFEFMKVNCPRRVCFMINLTLKRNSWWYYGTEKGGLSFRECCSANSHGFSPFRHKE